MDARAFVRLPFLTVSDQGVSGQPPAMQMFDPPVSDGGNQRQAALSAQYRAETLEEPSGRTPEPRALKADRSAREVAATTVQNEPMDARPKHLDVSRATHAAPGDLKPRIGTIPQSRQASSQPSMPTEAPSVPRRSANLSTGHPSQTPRSPAASSLLPATASAARPLQADVGSPRGSPARQIGELLAAGRVGQVDSARTGSASSAQSATRPPLTEQRFFKTPPASAPPRSEATHSGADETAAAVRSTFDRLVRSIRLRTAAQESSARLHLDPPEMGRVLVDVRMAGGALQIDVRTETPQARKLILARSPRLQAALEQQGIRVDHFEVTEDTADRSISTAVATVRRSTIRAGGPQLALSARRVVEKTGGSRSRTERGREMDPPADPPLDIEI